MLKRIVEFSVRFHGVIVALGVVTIIYGLWVTAHAKFDVFPEFAPPQVVIQTEAPGLSPKQVEALVTRPIESAVNGVVDLESIRSQSIQGFSIITVVFHEGAKILDARQMVGERLVEAAGRLPAGVGPPTMAPLTSSTSTVLELGLTPKTPRPPSTSSAVGDSPPPRRIPSTGPPSFMDLRSFADWTLRPRLLSVHGVAKVVIYGGEVRQTQIQIRPDRLMAYGLGINDVLEAARDATGVRGAGFIQTGPQRVVVRTEGQSPTPQQLGRTMIAHHNGVSIRLEDVAKVVEAPEPKFGDAAINGRPGVVLIVSSQYGANTLEVTHNVEQALAEMQPVFDAQRIDLHPRLFRPANFIDTAITNMRSSLLAGGVLVAIVLFLFLLDLRIAFISLTAIPLSLLVAVIILDYFGVTLNTMTLGGLAIATGEVVDDAIIDVENILRRLSENRASPSPRPIFKVVIGASLEVRNAVVYATFIVALVFLPVLTMSGLQGRLFGPLGMAYILAIMASLAVALTVTPALSILLLGRSKKSQIDPSFIVSLKRRYNGWLERFARRPGLVMGIVLVLCLGAAGMLPLFGGEFLPEFQEGNLTLHMSTVPGTSLRESLRLGRKVTSTLLANPHIRSMTQRIGRAERGDDIFGTHYSESDLDFVPMSGEESEQVPSEIRAAVADFPGVYFAMNPFLTERIEETLTGITAEVAIKVFGNDLDLIDAKAREIGRVVSGVRGAADVQVLSPPGAPQMVIRLRRDRLLQLGFQPVEVLDAIATALQGTTVGQTFEGNRVFDVVVILDPALRRDPEKISGLLLRNRDGASVPLKNLATLDTETGPYVVMHDGTQRFQAITCNVVGRDIASFTREIKQRIQRDVRFPSGVYPVFTGTGEAQSEAQQEILLKSGVVIVGIVILLSMVLGNARNLILVLMNLPFALVGGVLGVFATGGWLSIGTLVGFVTLFGITTRNSIMMISHYDHLVRVDGLPWGLATALRGARDRLVPIAMTALTTALGLLPLAIGTGEAGREIEGPMAIVILGGLATSTLLNLLVLPTLALKFGRFEARAV